MVNYEILTSSHRESSFRFSSSFSIGRNHSFLIISLGGYIAGLFRISSGMKGLDADTGFAYPI
jgi:hypothetical protein